MLLGPRAGGRGRSTSPNVTPNVRLGLVVEVAQQVQMLLGLGLVVKVAQQVQMLLRARAGGRGRSTSPNVTQG